MMIKSPEDSQLARAPRMEAASPQRRLFAARGLIADSLTRRRRGAPKRKEPRFKIQLTINSNKFPPTFQFKIVLLSKQIFQIIKKQF